MTSDRIINPATAASTTDAWSQIASDAYRGPSEGRSITPVASACNSKLDAPMTPAERLTPLPEFTITETPSWGCGGGRQIQRKPGAA